jgi:hypothetical protein
VHQTLNTIADLKLKDGDTLSETAIVLRLIDGPDTTATREAVRDAFQLLTDIGIVAPVVDRKGRRPTTLWTFHEMFTPEDVADVAGWDGRAKEAFREEDKQVVR